MGLGKKSSWAKKSFHGKGEVHVDLVVADFGRSKSFLLGEGTIVPVDEAEDADEEESLGDVGRRSSISSWCSSCSSKVRGGRSGGRRER